MLFISSLIAYLTWRWNRQLRGNFTPVRYQVAMLVLYSLMPLVILVMYVNLTFHYGAENQYTAIDERYPNGKLVQIRPSDTDGGTLRAHFLEDGEEYELSTAGITFTNDEEDARLREGCSKSWTVDFYFPVVWGFCEEEEIFVNWDQVEWVDERDG